MEYICIDHKYSYNNRPSDIANNLDGKLYLSINVKYYINDNGQYVGSSGNDFDILVEGLRAQLPTEVQDDVTLPPEYGNIFAQYVLDNLNLADKLLKHVVTKELPTTGKLVVKQDTVVINPKEGTLTLHVWATE